MHVVVIRVYGVSGKLIEITHRHNGDFKNFRRVLRGSITKKNPWQNQIPDLQQHRDQPAAARHFKFAEDRVDVLFHHRNA